MKTNNKGQALVEYVIVIGLIAVLVVTLVAYLGGYLKDAITKSSCSIVGEKYVKGEKAGEGKCVPDDNGAFDNLFGN